MSDDIVTRLRACWCHDAFRDRGRVDPACDHDGVRAEAAGEIERLWAEKDALLTANHQAMWDDTLIPIALALGVDIKDENGVLRRQFQMVEAIIKAVRGD